MDRAWIKLPSPRANEGESTKANLLCIFVGFIVRAETRLICFDARRDEKSRVIFPPSDVTGNHEAVPLRRCL